MINMLNTFLKTRTIQKHDTADNWSKSSFVPERGELIVYDRDNTCSYARLKIGDGVTLVNELPFVNMSIEDIDALIDEKLGVIENGTY